MISHSDDWFSLLSPQKVVSHLVNHVYSAPTQVATVMDMQEVVPLPFRFNICMERFNQNDLTSDLLWSQKNIEGRNYYTFEYVLTSSNFARAAFATIAIGNGMNLTFGTCESTY